MAETNPTDRECDPVAEDVKVERAVLAFLIEEHPVQLTIPELSLAMNAGPKAFVYEDAVERAVLELVGAGLLRCQGGYVLPTRAVLYAERLAPFGG